MFMQRSAAALVACLGLAAIAGARPVINGAVLHTRIFNDFPNSTLVTTNNYPALIQFSDGPVGPGAFANRHNFRLSANAGVSDAVFMNGDGFIFQADVALLGTGPVEGGLQVSPWYSQQVDGQFNIRLDDGEVAVFGGRLPFFSFTGVYGLHYLAGTTVHEKIIYDPHGLSAVSPGTIEYIYTDGTGTYSSGVLAFDQGNPAEDPPYGLYGILNDARVGGVVQVMNFNAGQHSAGIRFSNINYVPTPGSMGVLALGGLLAARRRRRA